MSETTDTGPSNLAATFGRCTPLSSHPIHAFMLLGVDELFLLDLPDRCDPERSPHCIKLRASPKTFTPTTKKVSTQPSLLPTITDV